MDASKIWIQMGFTGTWNSESLKFLEVIQKLLYLSMLSFPLTYPFYFDSKQFQYIFFLNVGRLFSKTASILDLKCEVVAWGY